MTPGTTPASFPELPWIRWLAVAGDCPTGLVLGDVATRYVPTCAARILPIILACPGADATTVRGVLAAGG